MFRHNGKIIGLNSFVFYSNVIIRKKYVSTTTSINIYHYYQMYYSLGIKQNIMELWTFTKNSNSINQKQTSKSNPRKKKQEIHIFPTRKEPNPDPNQTSKTISNPYWYTIIEVVIQPKPLKYYKLQTQQCLWEAVHLNKLFF